MSPANNLFPALNDLDYHHTLMTLTGVVLVYFTAPDCGACRSLQHALAAYQQQTPDVKIFAVDAVQNGGLINEFGIFHLPALLMYLDGAFHAELKCPAVSDAISANVQAALQAPPEPEP